MKDTFSPGWSSAAGLPAATPRLMQARRLALAGCFEIEAFHAADGRGSFTKLFSAGSDLPGVPGPLTLGELFVTHSRLGVLRGMHLQEPPFDQHKLVFCISGAAHDVLIDLRCGSSTEGQMFETTLSGGCGRAILVAPGVAHGFLTTADDTVILYCTTRPYSSVHDTGVRWDSIGASWPISPTVVSERDSGLPPIDEYQSPFVFEDEAES